MPNDTNCSLKQNDGALQCVNQLQCGVFVLGTLRVQNCQQMLLTGFFHLRQKAICAVS